MVLRELLDTLRADILHDRSDRIEGDNDYLWSDTTLIRYIDEAQRRFARRSLCIRDATSPVSRFTTVAYQQDYRLDPSIVSVASIRSLGNGVWYDGLYRAGTLDLTKSPPFFTAAPLGTALVQPDPIDLYRASHDQRGRPRDADEPFDVNNPGTLGPGKPLAFETDETMGEAGGSAGVVTVRLSPMPSPANAGCVMQMRVARLPLIRLTVDNLQAVPEIPEDYHLDMLDWAAYRALRIDDHEMGDPQRAQEFASSFTAHVEEARREIMRKAFQPMRFGYGRNGFSYTGN